MSEETETYVGLDVSLLSTAICVLDKRGEIVFEGDAGSDPNVLKEKIMQHAPGCRRIALETGATSPWLWRELKKRDLPVLCLDGRHAHKALSMRRNKTDKNDARGLAELVRIGWYKEASVRTVDAQHVRSLLSARYQMRLCRRDILNQMRGVVKTFGLFTASTATRRFPQIVRHIISEQPIYAPILKPLLAVHDTLQTESIKIESELNQIARDDPDAQRIMTVPGVGVLVALAFMSAIDNPKRFSSSQKVGPYLGLAPRVRQSGEMNWDAGIGSAADPMVRSYLYQAATVLLTKTTSWSKLKAWGLRLKKRVGFKRAAVAVARKLAIIMHAIWVDGTEFEYGSKTTA